MGNLALPFARPVLIKKVGGGWNYVNSGGSATTIPITVGIIPPGSCVVVTFRYESYTGAPASVTDNLGGKYVLAGVYSGNQPVVGIYVCLSHPGCTGGTVTVNLGTAASYRSGSAVAFSGVASVSARTFKSTSTAPRINAISERFGGLAIMVQGAFNNSGFASPKASSIIFSSDGFMRTTAWKLENKSALIEHSGGAGNNFSIAVILNPKSYVSRLFVPLAAGALTASASGAAQSNGAAVLATSVTLSAVGISVVNGTASAAAQIPLSAAGIAVSGGAANATATVSISAAALAQAAGQAGLSASVLLAAAGAAQAAGNTALAALLNALAAGASQASGTANLSGGAPGALNAAGGAVASGSAALSVTVVISASGSGVAAGLASLSGGAPGQIAAAGAAQAGGAATASAMVGVTAAGFVQAMGDGVWSVTVPLTAFGGAVTSGGAHLTELGNIVFTRAPSGAGPTPLIASGQRVAQSNQTRPGNTGGRRI